MKRSAVLMLLTTALAGGLGLAAPAPGSAICELILRRAAPDTGTTHAALRAEGGRFVAGVTVGPLGPTEVDCSTLVFDGKTVTGVLRVTVGFDGFFPVDRKPVTTEYTLDAKVADGKVSGTFEAATAGRKLTGVVEGAVAAPPDMSGYWVMDLQVENGRGAGTLNSKSWGERVYPKLFLKDGRFVQNLIYGWGGRVQINYFESVITANALRFDGKTLVGALTVQPTTGPAYVFTLDGAVVGTQIGGMFTKRIDAKEEPGGPFHGTLKPIPARPLDQSMYYLELHQAVSRTWADEEPAANKLQLMAFAPCVRGAFGGGVAYAAAWNHAYHDLDAAGLKRDGDRLTGELKVSMHPDPYMPPDHKPVVATYTVDAKIIDGRLIQGSYTGTFKDRKVTGPIFGELLDQPSVPEPVAINVKLEDGVNGGAPWHRRTYIGFTAVKGLADHGSMSNNKNGWKGTFTKAEVKFDGATFTATVEGTVDETVGPEKGAYTFKLTGKVVGDQLIGTCDTYCDGKLTKTGTDVMGSFTPMAPKAN